MQNDSTRSDGTIIEGLVITVFLDQGPANIYNSSPLHNNDAYNMAIWNLPMLDTEELMLLGEILPCEIIPTQIPPSDNSFTPFMASPYLFYLPADDSSDPRMAKNGRLVVFWLISRSNAILSYESKIKRIIKQVLRLYKIAKDDDLYNEEILKKIDEKLTTTVRGAARKQL
ncbi:MAG: hypothetical protein ACE5OZ_08465 [Candidatus Heimdallarchaeota archaeon]